MAEPTKARVILTYLGYALLTLLMTLYFTLVTFPYERIKDRFLPEILKALPYSLDIGEIQATPFLGVKASDVVIYTQKGLEEPTERKVLVTLQKVKIRPSLLSLVLGRRAAHIKGWLYGGTVKGRIGERGPSIDVVATLKDIALKKYSDSSKAMKLDGTFSGAIDLRVPSRDPALSEGSLDLRLSDGALKESLQVYSFSLPELNAITGTCRIQVGNRKATIEELSLASSEITLSLTGDMDLSPSLAQSRMNVKGSLTLSGRFASQYDPLLQGLLRTKNKDGSYPFSIRGTLSQPRFGV